MFTVVKKLELIEIPIKPLYLPVENLGGHLTLGIVPASNRACVRVGFHRLRMKVWNSCGAA